MEREGDGNCRSGRGLLWTMLSLVALTAVLVAMPVGDMAAQRSRLRPTVPTVDRHQPGKVFLEHADRLSLDSRNPDYQVLTGNVLFRRGDMFMSCDSAYFYDRIGSLQAFGSVKMEQGDTLFVFADELNYDGPTELAILYADPGKKVRLINRDVKLETDIFQYDMGIDLGYYEVGGVLTDKQNRLESLQGEYSPTTKDAVFSTGVVLTSPSDNDTLVMYTDTLLYSTATRIAEIVCPTEIIGKDGVIYSTSGTYNTTDGQSDLYERSVVKTSNGNTLTGDTLFYDRNLGYGEAFGDMVLVDTTRKTTLKGDYGFYNELTDSAFVTGRALAMEYSRVDTLFMHGDTIRAFMLKDDSTHVTNVYHKVRFWRVDVQGICDSLSFHERDSILYMYRHPVIWSGERQIFGNEINLHLNDSTVDWALLPDFGFMAEAVEGELFNQLSGKVMKAFFDGNELKRLDVDGNVIAIMIPQENDSTYNKIVNMESSFLKADFKGRSIDKAVIWPEVTGTVTPLFLAKSAIFYQPKFKWYESVRPKDKDDIFVVPPDMEALLQEPDPSERRRAKR
ncbi:MAG: hypothetical protein NC117_03790 [Pseudoflavonifractor sp.]|nr:hypothetical protein [Pseudoflavonifractor sp.]